MCATYIFVVVVIVCNKYDLNITYYVELLHKHVKIQNTVKKNIFVYICIVKITRKLCIVCQCVYNRYDYYYLHFHLYNIAWQQSFCVYKQLQRRQMHLISKLHISLFVSLYLCINHCLSVRLTSRTRVAPYCSQFWSFSGYGTSESRGLDTDGHCICCTCTLFHVFSYACPNKQHSLLWLSSRKPSFSGWGKGSVRQAKASLGGQLAVCLCGSSPPAGLQANHG